MDKIYKRPVVSFCITMIAGIITVFLSNSAILAVCFFILMLAFFYTFAGKRGRSLFVPVGMLAFYLLGAFEFLAYDNYQAACFAEYNGEEISVHGYVASEPEIKGEKVSYIINVVGIRRGYTGGYSDKRGKILLSTLRNGENAFLDYGRELLFEGVLSLPKGVRNPGGFDYRRYLAQKGVGASVFAYPYAITAGEGKKGNFLVQAGLGIRGRIVHVINNSLPRQQAGLLNGMLIGYREGLSEEVKEAFSNAGLMHVMAVSGANVAFLILPLSFLFKLARIRKRAANLLIIAFLELFVFVTGFEPSVLRAVIMASILLASAVLYSEPDTYTSIALSCIILLAMSPHMLFNIGFQLSYGATLGIFMLGRNLEKIITCRVIPAKAAQAISVTLAAQLGVLPITLIHFNKVSVISIIPNMLAAPMLELITIMGMLMALLGQFSLAVSRFIGIFNRILLSAVLYIAKLASDVPFAAVRTVTPPLVMAVAYYIAVWFLFWYRPMKGIILKKRHIAAAASIAAAAFLVLSLRPGCLEVVFLDVGQGDSAFIRTYAGKTALIDGGGSSNPAIASRIGETTVIPFLLDSGAGSIDVVVATHPHSDHIQGLESVLEQMKVNMLVLPSIADESGFGKLLNSAGLKNIPVFRCSSGDVIWLDDRTSMRVLYPENSCPVDDESLNNVSLVLKLCYGDTSILFTGDAETELENKLLAGPAELDADVIKIAHHGSASSTGKDFIEAVDPDAAIISVGKNNFGHPSRDVLMRLEQNDIEYLRTDECGAIVLKSDGRTIRIRRTVKESEMKAIGSKG